MEFTQYQHIERCIPVESIEIVVNLTEDLTEQKEPEQLKDILTEKQLNEMGLSGEETFIITDCKTTYKKEK